MKDVYSAKKGQGYQDLNVSIVKKIIVDCIVFLKIIVVRSISLCWVKNSYKFKIQRFLNKKYNKYEIIYLLYINYLICYI